MKKILFLINTLTSGGAEKVLVDTVNNLSNEKYEITVQTFIDKGSHLEKLNKNIRYKSVIKTKNEKLRRIFFKALNSFITAKWVYNLFIKDDYDIEIAFAPGFPTKIIAASTNARAKKITWLHGTMIKKGTVSATFKSDEKEHKAYSKFDTVVCVSEEAKKSFISRMGNKFNVKVLYNIYESNTILKMAEEKCPITVAQRPLLVTIGRLKKVKGNIRLLEAHKKLIAEGLRHTLWIIGEGDEYETLKNFICQNNLQDTAFLLGFHHNPYKYLKEADLFVCPSYSEGYSMAVSEAALLNIPVISTKWAGVYEPYESPRCDVVVENKTQALYEGLKELLSNPEKLKQLKSAKSTAFLTTEYLVGKVEEFLDNI